MPLPFAASIVHGHFPELCMECEPLLEEGAPVRPEPPPENWSPTDDQFREDGARIEAAFKKYFHRASVEAKQDSYELLVCHGNVIRYCVCRALQVGGGLSLTIRFQFSRLHFSFYFTTIFRSPFTLSCILFHVLSPFPLSCLLFFVLF